MNQRGHERNDFDVILAISLPAAAADRDTPPRPTDEPVAAAEQAPARPAPRPAPPAATERKRRGSMVGYITDATVESQVRVRFDAGFHSDRPDRSEFFYAQCGCNGRRCRRGPKGWRRT